MSALTQVLIREIETAPEALQQEVLDFVVFLKSKERSRSEGREDWLPLAQSAWGPDWDTAEEDAAWRDL